MEARSMSAVTREEFEARVGVIEREVEGEKMVTVRVGGYSSSATRTNSRGLVQNPSSSR